MNNINKRTIIFGTVIILCCIVFFIDYSNKGDSIVVNEVTDGYEIVLYDKENNIFFSQIMPVMPTINKLSEDVYEIRISLGSPAAYVFFADTKRAIVSQTYFNPILIENKYIAYMDDGTLIITDLFLEKKFYQEIIRNFSKTANPISAVINIEMPDNENIRLEYYEGFDYTHRVEMISIN